MILNKSRINGFSLIEVLISMLVLATGILGLIKLQAYMEVKSENALMTIDALYLAEEKLEGFRSRMKDPGVIPNPNIILYDAIKSGNEDLTINGKAVKRTTYVVDDKPVIGVKKIRVTVSWDDRWGVNQKVQLDTAISQYSEFDS